jgi:hypothetical protein
MKGKALFSIRVASTHATTCCWFSAIFIGPTFHLPAVGLWLPESFHFFSLFFHLSRNWGLVTGPISRPHHRVRRGEARSSSFGTARAVTYPSTRLPRIGRAAAGLKVDFSHFQLDGLDAGENDANQRNGHPTTGVGSDRQSAHLLRRFSETTNQTVQSKRPSRRTLIKQHSPADYLPCQNERAGR